MLNCEYGKVIIIFLVIPAFVFMASSLRRNHFIGKSIFIFSLRINLSKKNEILLFTI